MLSPEARFEGDCGLFWESPAPAVLPTQARLKSPFRSPPTLTIPRTLTIAGSDSGGGAGIQADLKTFTVLGTHGMSVLTALTAQNTLGVQAVHGVPTDFVEQQYASVVSDIGVDALKTGMLGEAAMVQCVAGLLADGLCERIVVDPVMVAKGGATLLSDDAVDALRRLLLPRALVLTPNLPEAAVLVGGELDTPARIREAARALHALGARHVLMKGGHAPGDELVDRLYDGQAFIELRAQRMDTPHTHGTGCTFAAALTAALAHGKSVSEAFPLAHGYVQRAIRHAPGLGHGHGPLGHWAAVVDLGEELSPEFRSLAP